MRAVVVVAVLLVATGSSEADRPPPPRLLQPPQSTEEIVEQAKDLYSAGERQAAIEKLEGIQDPPGYVYELLARWYPKVGNLKKAEAVLLDNLIPEPPRLGRFEDYRALVEIYVQQGRHVDVLEASKRALEAESPFAINRWNPAAIQWIHEARATALLALGRTDDAKREQEQASIWGEYTKYDISDLKRRSGDFGQRYQSAGALCDSGQFDEGLHLLQGLEREVEGAEPSTYFVSQLGDVYYYTGLCLYRKGEYNSAAEHLKRAVALGDADPHGGLPIRQRHLLAATYIAIGKNHEAIETLEGAEDEIRAASWSNASLGDAARFRVHNARGVAYFNLKQHARAIEELEKALALDPDHQETAHNLTDARAMAAAAGRPGAESQSEGTTGAARSTLGPLREIASNRGAGDSAAISVDPDGTPAGRSVVDESDPLQEPPVVPSATTQGTGASAPLSISSALFAIAATLVALSLASYVVIRTSWGATIARGVVPFLWRPRSEPRDRAEPEGARILEEARLRDEAKVIAERRDTVSGELRVEKAEPERENERQLDEVEQIREFEKAVDSPSDRPNGFTRRDDDPKTVMDVESIVRGYRALGLSDADLLERELRELAQSVENGDWKRACLNGRTVLEVVVENVATAHAARCGDRIRRANPRRIWRSKADFRRYLRHSGILEADDHNAIDTGYGKLSQVIRGKLQAKEEGPYWLREIGEVLGRVLHNAERMRKESPQT